MPLLSAFTPCGMLAFSRQPPIAQRIYEDLMRSWGGTANFDETFDNPHAAIQYAHAMTLASCELTLERAGNNANPKKAVEMLAEIEHDYCLSPPANSTLWERRRDLSVAKALIRGATEESVVTSLQALLGDDFVAFRPTPIADLVTKPDFPYTTPGCWSNLAAPIKLWRLTGSVMYKFPTEVTVGVEFVDGSTEPLAAGELVVLDAGRTGCEEATTLLGVTDSTITVSCAKSHDNGGWVRSGYYPYWISNKRHSLIVVSATARADPEIMRKIHLLMHKLMRGVSTWSVVSETSPGSGVVGPTRVGTTIIGRTTIGTVTL